MNLFTTDKSDKLVQWSVSLSKPGAFKIIDEAGETVGSIVLVMKMPPPEPMPQDFDIETERRRLKSGGCCGSPSGE